MDKNIALIKEALDLFLTLFTDLEKRVLTIELLLDIEEVQLRNDPAPEEEEKNDSIP